METSDIEFYEGLRAHIPEEAARLIAERFPQPRDLATKGDLRELEAARSKDIQGVRIEIQELKADIRGWMLAFFIPLWIGVYGTLAAVVISLLGGG